MQQLRARSYRPSFPDRGAEDRQEGAQGDPGEEDWQEVKACFFFPFFFGVRSVCVLRITVDGDERCEGRLERWAKPLLSTNHGGECLNDDSAMEMPLRYCCGCTALERKREGVVMMKKEYLIFLESSHLQVFLHAMRHVNLMG
jgi:hypothetical protein